MCLRKLNWLGEAMGYERLPQMQGALAALLAHPASKSTDPLQICVGSRTSPTLHPEPATAASLAPVVLRSSGRPGRTLRRSLGDPPTPGQGH